MTLRDRRARAGGLYAKAAAAYVAAAIELDAFDGACGNALLGDGPVGRFSRHPEVLAHPEFLPPAAAAALTSLNITEPKRQARLDVLLNEARTL